MNNRQTNLNTDNNRIAVVNAYIENMNHNQIILDQMMQLMNRQETTMRDLVMNGITLGNNVNNEEAEDERQSRTHTSRTTRGSTSRYSTRYTNPVNLSGMHSNSETSNIFNPNINYSHNLRPSTQRSARTSTQRSSRASNSPVRQSEERITNLLVSMLLPTLTGETNGIDDNFLTPVIVRPTQHQINRATEIIRYGDIENPPNSTCPITLNHFQDNVNVTRIMYCGHIFSENSLDNWFRENVRCPMCRYDIRNYTGSNIGGEGRRDINTSNINTENQEISDDNNMTSILDDIEENRETENNENLDQEETIENNNSNDETNNTPFPRNSFAGLFTNSISNGNDISNILNTFIGDLQNDPLFTNFSQQGRNGRFDASGNYIFETYIPINFNSNSSNNTNNNN